MPLLWKLHYLWLWDRIQIKWLIKMFAGHTHKDPHMYTHKYMHPHACTAVKSTLSSRLSSVQLHREEKPGETKLSISILLHLAEKTIAGQNSQVILIRLTEHHMLWSLPPTHEKEKSHSPKWQQRERERGGESAKAGSLAKNRHPLNNGTECHFYIMQHWLSEAHPPSSNYLSLFPFYLFSFVTLWEDGNRAHGGEVREHWNAL